MANCEVFNEKIMRRIFRNIMVVSYGCLDLIDFDGNRYLFSRSFIYMIDTKISFVFIKVLLDFCMKMKFISLEMMSS